MILITGWSGNTGSYVVRQLRDKFPQKTIVGISRNYKSYIDKDFIIETADLSDEKKVKSIFDKYNFELIIHIANIRCSPLLLNLAEMYKVPNIILVHTTGIYSKYRAYSSLYKEIEEAIFRQQFKNTAYTILRPTMIYGNSRDHNMHKLIRFLNRTPVFPVFGDGSSVMQPVHVEDLAKAIVACIENDKVKNKAYDLSGGSVITYKEILKTITNILEKRIIFIHVPLKLAIMVATLLRCLFKKPVISVEQVKRLQENKAYSHEKATMDLGFRPRTFLQGISGEISELRKEGLI